MILVSIKCFSPSERTILVSYFYICSRRTRPNLPGDTKTPLATSFHARDGTQVIALLGAEIEELLGDFRSDCMCTKITGGDFTVAVAQEACHGLGRVQGQWLLEDIETLRHGVGGAVMVQRLLGVVRSVGDCEEADEYGQKFGDVHQLVWSQECKQLFARIDRRYSIY